MIKKTDRQEPHDSNNGHNSIHKHRQNRNISIQGKQLNSTAKNDAQKLLSETTEESLSVWASVNLNEKKGLKTKAEERKNENNPNLRKKKNQSQQRPLKAPSGKRSQSQSSGEMKSPPHRQSSRSRGRPANKPTRQPAASAANRGPRSRSRPKQPLPPDPGSPSAEVQAGVFEQGEIRALIENIRLKAEEDPEHFIPKRKHRPGAAYMAVTAAAANKLKPHRAPSNNDPPSPPPLPKRAGRAISDNSTKSSPARQTNSRGKQNDGGVPTSAFDQARQRSLSENHLKIKEAGQGNSFLDTSQEFGSGEPLFSQKQGTGMESGSKSLTDSMKQLSDQGFSLVRAPTKPDPDSSGTRDGNNAGGASSLEDEEAQLKNAEAKLKEEMARLSQRRVELQLRKLEQQLREEATARIKHLQEEIGREVAARQRQLRHEDRRRSEAITRFKEGLKERIDRLCTVYEEVSARGSMMHQVYDDAALQVAAEAERTMETAQEAEEAHIRNKLLEQAKKEGWDMVFDG